MTFETLSTSRNTQSEVEQCLTGIGIREHRRKRRPYGRHRPRYGELKLRIMEIAELGVLGGPFSGTPVTTNRP